MPFGAVPKVAEYAFLTLWLQSGRHLGWGAKIPTSSWVQLLRHRGGLAMQTAFPLPDYPTRNGTLISNPARAEMHKSHVSCPAHQTGHQAY